MTSTDQALELIEQQPQTAERLERYDLSKPRLGLLTRTAALTVVVLGLLIYACALLDHYEAARFAATAPGALVGACTFGFARLVTDLIEENRREAEQHQLGDLVEQKGKASAKGQAVLDELRALRSTPLNISGSLTPTEALRQAAQAKRTGLGGGAPAAALPPAAPTPSTASPCHAAPPVRTPPQGDLEPHKRSEGVPRKDSPRSPDG